MLDKQKTKASFIGLAGNIGVGKTTFTKLLSKRLKWTPFFESVSDNPYLSDFYSNMKRWSFNLQIYFLHKRFEMHKIMNNLDEGTIQDRTIYEDVEIFAKKLHELGNISDRDYENYSGLFSVMVSYLKKPDLIVYLRASTDTLLNRIEKRGRDYEGSISPEYLHSLNISYDQWINSAKDYPVLIIETDDLNIFDDLKQVQEIQKMILDRI